MPGLAAFEGQLGGGAASLHGGMLSAPHIEQALALRGASEQNLVEKKTTLFGFGNRKRCAVKCCAAGLVDRWRRAPCCVRREARTP